MKILWAMVLLLVLGAVAVLAMGWRTGDAGRTPAASTLAAPTNEPLAAAKPVEKAAASLPASPQAAIGVPAAAVAPAPPSSVVPPVSSGARPLEGAAPVVATVPPASHSTAATPAQPLVSPATPGPAAMHAPSSPAGATATVPQPEAAPAAGAAALTADELAATMANPGASAPAAATAPEAGDNGVEANPRFPADKLVPAKVERKADGVMVLDGRFAVRGSGTREDPYRFPWDLLESAQETYKPRMGQMKLPQRVTMFDGKYIRVSGFVAFPITSANPREMLSMLNQWDGCCIGVPPTAYDAIEVKLAAPANAKQRLAVHGTVEGRLKVDPYLDGGWLLGLYLMEDAKLTIDD